MKKIWHWIRRHYYMSLSINGSFLTHSLYGKFRIQYKDGTISQKFSYKVAKDYAELFGGEVVDAF